MFKYISSEMKRESRVYIKKTHKNKLCYKNLKIVYLSIKFLHKI